MEYKHQDISATILDLGLPWIRGYKPTSNYQDALADGHGQTARRIGAKGPLS